MLLPVRTAWSKKMLAVKRIAKLALEVGPQLLKAFDL